MVCAPPSGERVKASQLGLPPTSCPKLMMFRASLFLLTRPTLLPSRPTLPRAAVVFKQSSEELHKELRKERHPALKGDPLSPLLDDGTVLLRYMYDGGVLSQGRLCRVKPAASSFISGEEIFAALRADDVDLDRFYACVYETRLSTGGWLRINEKDAAVELPAVDLDPGSPSCRVDVKLCVRAAPDGDARLAMAADEPPCGDIPVSGYCAVGVVNAKNQANVGTLWRSAYQLGAQFIFTIGTRYRQQPTDTVRAVQRMPLFELNSWSSFVEFAPHGARWIAVETGGTPLEDFEHPLDAVYILGSEDAGLPNSVLRACHDVVTLRSERYASYNVAVAGSLVLYDRQQKARARLEARKGSQ